MLRKVSRNCSSELSSAVSAPPKLPMKAPLQRNVLGGRIVETEPKNPPPRSESPHRRAAGSSAPGDAPATAALGPLDRGPPLFLRVVERPSRPPRARLVEPVETMTTVGSALAPTQEPLERA